MKTDNCKNHQSLYIVHTNHYEATTGSLTASESSLATEGKILEIPGGVLDFLSNFPIQDEERWENFDCWRY